MIRIFRILFFLMFFILNDHFFADAQKTTRKMTLQDVVRTARESSPDAFIARHRFKASYWQYRTFQAELMPSLVLDASLPDFNRSIEKYPTGNGEYSFVKSTTAYSSANLRVNKNMWLTGGNMFLYTDLARLDIFNNGDSFSYLSSPVGIGISIPVFGFNKYKWDRKIEPLKYLQAKNYYVESLEDISLKAVNYFFDLALAQQNVKIAEVNYANNDTLYKISIGRYNLGKIAQNELLQMELELLNSDAELNNARLELQIQKINLKTFLGITDREDIEIILPTGAVDFKIDTDKALAFSRQNSSDMIDYKTQLIEAKRDVARAKSESFFNASISASYGLTQSAVNLAGVYQDPQDKQSFLVGLQVPIIDWGSGRGKFRMAKSFEEVTKITVSQSVFKFEQGVFLQVAQFNMQAGQLRIAAKADTVADMRYEISKQRFYIGKIDITDLNLALKEKDTSKRNYISQLKNYWTYYYSIRRLTLFDFEHNSPLTVDFNELVR